MQLPPIVCWWLIGCDELFARDRYTNTPIHTETGSSILNFAFEDLPPIFNVCLTIVHNTHLTCCSAGSWHWQLWNRHSPGYLSETTRPWLCLQGQLLSVSVWLCVCGCVVGVWFCACVRTCMRMHMLVWLRVSVCMYVNMCSWLTDCIGRQIYIYIYIYIYICCVW